MQCGRNKNLPIDFSDDVVTLDGELGHGAASGTVDVPNTEHDNWGGSYWTHPIFHQWGKWVLEEW